MNRLPTSSDTAPPELAWLPDAAIVDIHLVADGIRIWPESADNGEFRFRLNLPAREIRLVSGSARPAQVKASADWRRLGVALRGLTWRQARAAVRIPISAPDFIDGFHALEEDLFRWTNGNAALPLVEWQGEATLHLTISEWEASRSRPQINVESAVMSRFENLGESCDLAWVQRHFDVELPLSLLRWSATDHVMLTRGLADRFSGLGDPGSTQVVWSVDDYQLVTPYLKMHTWHNVTRDKNSVAEIHRSGCATLRLLRRKLLDDIARDRRIFVFKTADPSFGETGMRRMHDAMREIGPARLLCVCLSTPSRRSGVVQRLADGLYLGALDRFVGSEGPYDQWYGLCATTLALDRMG